MKQGSLRLSWLILIGVGVALAVYSPHCLDLASGTFYLS